MNFRILNLNFSKILLNFRDPFPNIAISILKIIFYNFLNKKYFFKLITENIIIIKFFIRKYNYYNIVTDISCNYRSFVTEITKNYSEIKITLLIYNFLIYF